MRKVLKWSGIVLGTILVFVVVAGVAAFFVGSSKVGAVYDVQTASLTIRSDSATLARGAHLAAIHGCTDCHGADLSGSIMVDAPPFRLTASNLTKGAGGIGSTYTAEDFDRAIRHGVRKNGTALYIMPSAAFHNLSDEDAAAIIAHVQAAPPVDNVLPPTEVRAPGRLLVAAAALDPAFEVRTGRARTAAPAVAATAEYGEYLASVTCQYCHGSDLRGAQPPMPESLYAPDLAAAGQWTLDQFKHALRTGERPDGKPAMQQEFMPYKLTAHMTDVELEALHKYLATLLDA